MMPYSQELLLDDVNNYEIVKTEAIIGFTPPSRTKYVNNSYNETAPLEWFFSPGNFNSAIRDSDSRSLKNKHLKLKAKTKSDSAPSSKIIKEKKHRLSKGVKKCVLNVIKGHKHAKGGKRKKRKGLKKYKKYMKPLLIGLLVVKSLLIKVLAFLTAKGLLLGLFSTITATVLSLKGLWDHSHYTYSDRKDDPTTQVEIIQVPTKSEDHIYYDEHYSRRGDSEPDYPYSIPLGRLR